MALTEDEEDAEGGEDEEAEAEPVDDAGQRHGKKLSKEEQKALFAKFRKEIVLRNLIPVLSCLYRQLEYLDDGELLTGCVALVASTAKANDVNLEGRDVTLIRIEYAGVISTNILLLGSEGRAAARD